MNENKKIGCRRFLIVALVLILVAVGIGIDWYVYDTGKLKDHMTFLEWLLIRS